MNEEERLVVVTGAGRGVGAATVKALLRIPGTRVIAVSRTLNDLVASLDDPSRLECCPLDLNATDAATRLMAHIGGRRLHALVNNAGLLHKAEIGTHQRIALEKVFLTNAIAPLELSQALAPALAGEPPGHIVHIGSMGGFQDSVKFPGLVAYSASKAALACMAQCLAEEFKDKGVRSNCLALGSVNTAMLRAAFPDFEAATTVEEMGQFVAEFSLRGHNLFNGKVIPVASSTP